MKKMVSLVVCNFNRAKTIERAVRSCLSQVLNQRAVEVIVVDDCSTDESLSLLEHFGDEIKLIQNHTNLGIGVQRHCTKTFDGRILDEG